MTQTEEILISVGNALVRAMGPKVSSAVPCTCGAGVEQAQALSDWYNLTQAIKES